MGVAGDHIVSGKQVRSSGGIVLIADDMQLHIDPGPGTLIKNREYSINPRENTAILVSHSHLNHCNDVNALISATTANGLDNNCVLVAPDSLINGLGDSTPFLTEFHKNSVERVIELEEGKRIGINKIEIVALPTKHGDETGIGFKIFTSRFSMVYSGDTEYFEGIEELYKDVDILVLNVQEPFGKNEEGHLSADDAVKIIKAAKPKLAVVTHFGAKMIVADALSVTRDIQKESGVQTVAAKDGMIVDPLTNFISAKQKRAL
ncbi:MBL fold metallo-hydrolase [Candidatus Woesearchaeota archaeon]|nr:MBL fold metallo-hydrolase [Candidatus Woesearchaeota archaeon]